MDVAEAASEVTEAMPKVTGATPKAIGAVPTVAETTANVAETTDIVMEATQVATDTTSKVMPRDVPVYKYSFETAQKNNKADIYQQSRILNVDCGKAIKEVVESKAFMYGSSSRSIGTKELRMAAVKAVIDIYGGERVGVILAHSINAYGNENISPKNKEWAAYFNDFISQDKIQYPSKYLSTWSDKCLNHFVDLYIDATSLLIIEEAPQLKQSLDDMIAEKRKIMEERKQGKGGAAAGKATPDKSNKDNTNKSSPYDPYIPKPTPKTKKGGR